MSASGTSEQAFLDQIASAAQKRWPHTNQAETISQRLEGLGLTSKADLCRKLSQLEGDALCAAIWAAELLEVRSAAPHIISQIASPDAWVRGTAQAATSVFSSQRSSRALADIARTHPHACIACAACHALSFAYGEGADALLLDLFANADLPVRVRAQAAEGLGNTLGWTDRRRRLFRKAANLLIQALAYPSPELRFWCCFALGQMRARQATPELERLAATDDDFCPGWWHVRDEAADALTHIRGGCHAHRDTLGWTEEGPLVPEGYDADGVRI